MAWADGSQMVDGKVGAEAVFYMETIGQASAATLAQIDRGYTVRELIYTSAADRAGWDNENHGVVTGLCSYWVVPSRTLLGGMPRHFVSNRQKRPRRKNDRTTSSSDTRG